MAFLELERLTKAFGTHNAVDGLTLGVEKGEFVALLGPSGCGKTTTLQMIAGFVEPTSGAIRLAGKDLLAIKPAKRGLGIVFQSYALFPHMTVAQNIAFGPRERGVPKGEQDALVARFIEQVGLKGFENHFPKMLSGGMQQRTALARALANDPSILLLDEPFGALDNQTRSLMQELLLGIWEADRKTVLFVTHDIEEAIFMANRVAVFSARPGRIKTELAVDLPHPRHYTIKTSPEFMDLKARLTEEIRAESLAADLH